MSIRLATIHDLQAIVSIYNEFINTTVTMDTTSTTIESRTKWFDEHSPAHPLICSVNDKNVVTGWVSISKWSDKIGYNKTVELSVYVSKAYHNQGIGAILIKNAIEEAKKRNYHCIISRVDRDNTISLELHKKFGFTHVGIIKENGFKFGKFIDIVILQLLL